jgi:hypothetical protein
MRFKVFMEVEVHVVTFWILTHAVLEMIADVSEDIAAYIFRKS